MAQSATSEIFREHAKRQQLPQAATIFLLVVALTGAAACQEPRSDTRLLGETIARKINARAPARVNDQLSLIAARYSDEVLTLTYRINDDRFPGLAEAYRKKLTDEIDAREVCQPGTLRDALNAGITVEHVHVASSGKTVVTTRVTLELCNRVMHAGSG